MTNLLSVILTCATLLAASWTSAAAQAAAQTAAQDAAPGALLDWSAADGLEGWERNEPALITTVGRGNEAFVRFQTPDARRQTFLHRTLPLDGSVRQLRITAEVRLPAIDPGELHWQVARVVTRYTNATGMDTFLPPVKLDSPVDAWQTLSVTQEVPAGATDLQLEPGLYFCAGTFDLRRVRVEVTRQVVSTDSHWGSEPVETLSPVRGQIVLNGTWRFAPGGVDALAVDDDAAELGSVRVPASYHRRPDWRRPGLVELGQGAAWDAFMKDPLAAESAWYRRPIDIPAEWAGRAVELDFLHVSTIADVFIDGREAGRVPFGGGTLDVSQFVTPGERHHLAVRVWAVPDAAAGLFLQGEAAEQIIRRATRLSEVGLTGDVLLSSRPAGTHVSDVFVRPSVRDKRVELDVTLAGELPTAPLRFRARMLNEAGQEEVAFETQARPEARLTLGFDWPTPRLWDVGQPNLYTLHLEVLDAGGGVVDVYPQAFGFREFWIEGRDFVLNGTPIRLRPSQYVPGMPHVPTIRQWLADSVAVGFNISPTDGHLSGASNQTHLVAAEADRMGHLLIGWTVGMGAYAVDGTWSDPAVRDAWQERMAHALRRVRNHPSIVLWATSANTFAHGQDQNPRYVGNSRMLDIRDENAAWWRRAQAGLQAMSMIRALDATRPIYAHSGSFVGDLQVANMYLNFPQLQEREEWLSAWMTDGDRPFMAGEFGLPLVNTFTRGKAGGGWTSRTSGSYNSQPLMTEYAAAYLGPQAYRQEGEAYRQSIPARHAGAEIYTHALAGPILQEQNLEQLLSLFITNTYRSWRASGLSGGLVPWALGYHFHDEASATIDFGPFVPGQRGEYLPSMSPADFYEISPTHQRVRPPAEAFMAASGPTLAYIAGRLDDDDPVSFTEKAHQFHGGTTVAKSVALLNDRRKSIDYSYTLTVEVGGSQLHQVQERGAIAPARTLLLPVNFDVPVVEQPTAGHIVLSADLGGVMHQDTFAFTVHPAMSPAVPEVAVVDPVGKTSAMLADAGYRTRPPQPGDTRIILGREALTDGGLDLEQFKAFVEGGGTLLVMAQDPAFYTGRLGLRVSPQVERRAFPSPGGHGAIDWLAGEPLRDWAGTGTLVEPRPVYPVDGAAAGLTYVADKPLHGWRWGNRGSVASVVIEKPHRAGWRSLLDAGFDLAYSPLLFTHVGRGAVVLTTLDLEDNAALDPQAQRMLHALLEANFATPAASRTLYLGDEAGRQLLDDVGVAYESGAGTTPRSGDLLLLGEGHGLSREDLDRLVAAGVRAVLLPRASVGQDAGFSFASVAGFGGALDVPAWPQLTGLTISETRRHADADSVLLAGSPGAEVALGGLVARRHGGAVIAVQFDPRIYDVAAKPYHRYTRWRDTRALAVVLANAGVRFTQDATIFDPAAASAGLATWAGPFAGVHTVPLPAAPDLKAPHADAGISAAARRLIERTAARGAALPTASDAVTVEALTHDPALPDGEAVFLRQFLVPEAWAGRDLVLHLGRVDDFDDTFVNGQLVGRTDVSTRDAWSVERRYVVPAGVLRAGVNTLAVRVFDRFGGGGLMLDQAAPIRIGPAKSVDAVRGYYHPDYRTDFAYGDDPYRYYRW